MCVYIYVFNFYMQNDPHVLSTFNSVPYCTFMCKTNPILKTHNNPFVITLMFHKSLKYLGYVPLLNKLIFFVCAVKFHLPVQVFRP